MAKLQILKGPSEGSFISLDGDKFVMGRNPECGIVIPVTSVSREHAQILRVSGKYFIEDKQSRNGTFVNNQAISTRTALKNNDRIRICDFIACFLDQADSAGEEDEIDESSSTVEATINQAGGSLLEQQPAERLRHLIEITNNLSRTLELQSLLPKIADSLFALFRQADRCFLIVSGEGDKLQPRLVKTRRAADESNARFSRSIVKRALESTQAFLSDDASRDDRVQLSQSVVDFRIRSVMCAPLCRADGNAFAVIQLDTQDRSKKFSQDDLKLLCAVANQAAISLENARLLEDTIIQEKRKADLDLARKVQKSFLPSTEPKLPGYDFFGYSEPAKEVGGDYFGYIPLPDGKLVVAVGDVAGKGAAASLIMAKLSSDIRFSMLSEKTPEAAVAKLNDLLYEFTSSLDRFVTLIAVVIDPVTHIATMVSGGHSSPQLYRPLTGELKDSSGGKDFGGPPLGMIEGLPFESCQVKLEPGDCLILYTDGVDESMNVQGKAFEHAGVERAVRAASKTGPREIGEQLVAAVKQHAAGRDPHDDMTVVVIGRKA
ncbi:MAG: FHA domain-containing protein [Planctomycetia bacterium]|nr:FHA domain-containing protein [Planctomycetia bacterium]